MLISGPATVTIFPICRCGALAAYLFHFAQIKQPLCEKCAAAERKNALPGGIEKIETLVPPTFEATDVKFS